MTHDATGENAPTDRRPPRPHAIRHENNTMSWTNTTGRNNAEGHNEIQHYDTENAPANDEKSKKQREERTNTEMQRSQKAQKKIIVRGRW